MRDTYPSLASHAVGAKAPPIHAPDIWAPTRAPADRLRAAVADPIAAVEMLKGKYVCTSWGDELHDKFDALYQRHLVRLEALNSRSSENALQEGALLCVTGQTQAGKTTTLAKLFASYQEFAGHERIENGARLLSIRAPASCTPLRLATTLLDALGYPVRGRMEEHRQWNEVHRRLQECAVHVVHIDEMQHASHVANVKEIDRLGASIKGLLVHPRWPVLVVVAGVPRLLEFVSAYKELDRRTTYCRIPSLNLNEADNFVEIAGRICGKVGLELKVNADTEFGERLIVAARYQFGGVVEWTIDAIELALRRLHNDEPSPQGGVVDFMDFGAAYARRRDCDRCDNVFLVSNWPNWLARQEEERRAAAALDTDTSLVKRRGKRR